MFYFNSYLKLSSAPGFRRIVNHLLSLPLPLSCTERVPPIPGFICPSSWLFGHLFPSIQDSLSHLLSLYGKFVIIHPYRKEKGGMYV